MSMTNQALVFLPVLTVVLVTFAGFVRLAAGRAAAIRHGQDPAFYRAHVGAPEPETAAAGARHWDNLFELPTIFYAACLTAFVLGEVGFWTLAFAWAFAAGRIVQSAVHMTYNNPAHRGMGFMLAVITAFLLWIDVAISVWMAI